MPTTITLPNAGDTNWSAVLNTAITTVNAAQDATAATVAGLSTGGGASQAAIDARTITDVNTTSTAGALQLHKITQVDATAGTVAMTLPTGAPAGTIIVVEKADSTTNTVTVTGNIRGVAGVTQTLSLPQQSVMYVSASTGSWEIGGGHHTLTSLDGRYDASGVAATAVAAEATARDAAIATQHTADIALFGTAAGAVPLFAGGQAVRDRGYGNTFPTTSLQTGDFFDYAP